MSLLLLSHGRLDLAGNIEQRRSVCIAVCIVQQSALVRVALCLLLVLVLILLRRRRRAQVVWAAQRQRRGRVFTISRPSYGMMVRCPDV